MSQTTIEMRLQRLEDCEAIRTLMMRYADIINNGWGGRIADAYRLHEVFATDAHWSSEAMGIDVTGIDTIAAGLAHSTANIAFSQHVFLNSLIEVDGDHASATWLMWIAACGHDSGSRMVYVSENVVYTRTAQGWRIQTLTLEVAGFSPLAPAAGE